MLEVRAEILMSPRAESKQLKYASDRVAGCHYTRGTVKNRLEFGKKNRSEIFPRRTYKHH